MEKQVITVKVVPKAGKSEVVGYEGENLKVRLNAVPEKGEANKELIKVLAKHFNVAKSEVKILRGEHSRVKLIEVGKSRKSPGK